jgi:hypothetical protein
MGHYYEIIDVSGDQTWSLGTLTHPTSLAADLLGAYAYFSWTVSVVNLGSRQVTSQLVVHPITTKMHFVYAKGDSN